MGACRNGLGWDRSAQVSSGSAPGWVGSGSAQGRSPGRTYHMLTLRLCTRHNLRAHEIGGCKSRRLRNQRFDIILTKGQDGTPCQYVGCAAAGAELERWSWQWSWRRRRGAAEQLRRGGLRRSPLEFTVRCPGYVDSTFYRPPNLQKTVRPTDTRHPTPDN